LLPQVGMRLDTTPPLLARTVRDLISAGRACLPTVDFAMKPSRGTAVSSRTLTDRDHLEADLLELTDRERERIGSELHDDLGQLLAATALLTTTLESTLTQRGAPEAAAARRIREIVERAIDHTSRLARHLATLELRGQSLSDALCGLATETRALFDVCCRVRIDGEPPPVDPTTAHHAYKIAQEAVTNAIKHGQARTIEITLASRRGEGLVTVCNDGAPFSERAVENGRMGLRYMRHRASVIGATLTIRAEDGGGTAVRCVFPVPADAVA